MEVGTGGVGGAGNTNNEPSYPGSNGGVSSISRDGDAFIIQANGGGGGGSYNSEEGAYQYLLFVIMQFCLEYTYDICNMSYVLIVLHHFKVSTRS